MKQLCQAAKLVTVVRSVGEHHRDGYRSERRSELRVMRCVLARRHEGETHEDGDGTRWTERADLPSAPAHPLPPSTSTQYKGAAR